MKSTLAIILPQKSGPSDTVKKKFEKYRPKVFIRVPLKLQTIVI